MKKGGIILLILLAVLAFVGCGQYNGLVTIDEKAEKSWADVQNQYQRRADLVNNLVATVKGAADFEKETLTQVIEARAKATSIQVDPSKLTSQKMQEFQAAQGELSQALGRLLVSVERYPELKANQNFLDLQVQLEGTENRIATARKDYNAVVQEYNTKVRKMPAAIFAGIFGFDARAPFAADADAQKAPEVDFSN
jgi:LemA protein